MRIVYATGTGRGREFAVAQAPESLPEGAQVFAVCNGAEVARCREEQLDSLADGEYYAFQSALREAAARELQAARPSRAEGRRGLLRRLIRI